MSTSARHRLSYIAETTYGTTPATPAFLNFQHVGCTLGLTKDTSVSKTQRADRQVHHTRHGLKNVAGEVTGEFAPITFDDMLSAAFCAAWVGSGPFTLTPGALRQSFSIMRTFQDQLSGDNPFHLFTGVEVNTMSLTVDTKDEVNVKFGLIGQAMAAPAATAPTGSTFAGEQTQVPFNGLSGTIQEGGSSIAQITGLTLNIENGMEPRFVLMQDTTRLPKQGRFTVGGSITALFENSTLLSKFIAGTQTSLEFALQMSGYTYDFKVPNIKYNGGQPDTSEQSDIVLTLPFTAAFDSTLGTSLLLTKTAP